MVAILSTLAMFACSTVGVRQAPEPAFTVTARIGDVEIRQYGPRAAAETVVPGDEMDARSTGFRRLADYIFGGNQGAVKIEMTAPVAQEAGSPGTTMTMPLTQERDIPGSWRIRFFMPAPFTLATLPKPNNAAVTLVVVPPETLAVLRFSGSTAPDAIATRTSQLVAALEGSAWRPTGAPVAWFYDPPWTLPPLRRNEVVIPVSPN